MRKIVVISMISLDGVMQAPGGPGEDKSNGFKYGGWVAPYQDEGSEVFAKLLQPSDILLGRKTYEIFAGYWPQHADSWPGINEVTKYYLSAKKTAGQRWQNSVVLKNIGDVRKLKSSNGADIKVWGSSKLVQLLLKHGLVDELWLIIYPLTLGKGKKLFDGSAMPTAFMLAESSVTPGGVIIANYRRAGTVKTGTVGA